MNAANKAVFLSPTPQGYPPDDYAIHRAD